MTATRFPGVKPKRDELGPGHIPAYKQADIPKVDTKAGPGVENLQAALRKDNDPLSAVNADEEKSSRVTPQ